MTPVATLDATLRRRTQHAGGNVDVVIVEDAAAVAERAAAQIAALIQRTPGLVLGLATGSSPVGTYDALAVRVRSGELDCSAVSGFALDEYAGIDYAHPESYHAVIRRTVTEPLGLDPDRVHVPDGNAADLAQAGEHYERLIAEAGGVDLQLLGIGANGHIGFNEPISSFDSRTRMKTLSPQTRADNARFFDRLEDVPLQSITQGIGTILAARELLLVAQGESKAAAVAAMVEGPLASRCPASALQMHRRATVIVDRAAASQLEFIDYYEQVERHRAGAVAAV